MINSIHITNVQSHEDSTLNFHEGVNCIIGSSDSGKSTIIRSIKLVAWNRPSGDAIRSTWGGETSVELCTDEGKVSQIKDKIDSYVLVPAKGKALTFKAIGVSVPQEVQSFLNINEINLQYQLDSPFLLSLTPGQVAEHFNKVAKLDKIDKATSNVNSVISELTTTIGKEAIKDKPATGLIKRIHETEDQIESFSYLEMFEAKVEVLEEMDKAMTSLMVKESKLENIIVNINDTNAEIRELLPLLSLEQSVITVLNDIEKRAEMDVKQVRLDKLLMDIEENDKEIKQQQNLLKLEDDVNQIIWWIDQRDTFESQQKNLISDINELQSINIKILGRKTLIESLEKQFHKEMGTVCLLCGQPIKKK